MKLHSFRPTLDEAFEIFGDKSEYVVAAPQFPLHVVCSLSPSAYLLPNSRPNSALTRME